MALGARLKGLALLRAGRAAEALPLLEDARAGFVEVGAQGEVIASDGRIAECLDRLGETPRAVALAREAIARARGVGGANVHLPMLHRRLGIALVRAGDPAAARVALEESLEIARSREADFEVALTLDALDSLEPSADYEAERDRILAGLGAVAPSRAPRSSGS